MRYSFVAWPDETWKFERAVYDLFRMLNVRVEMQATEEEFERFRSGLSHHGITLREVEVEPRNPLACTLDIHKAMDLIEKRRKLLGLHEREGDMDWVKFKDQVKAANDIVEVIGEHLQLTKVGDSLRSPCPFHNESEMSFDVNPQRQRYRCWSCNKYGDVITFIQEHMRLGFQQSLEWLAKRAGIERPPTRECPHEAVKAKPVTDKDKAAILLHACMDMSRKGTTIDLITLSQHLSGGGLLDKVGGARWLADLWGTAGELRGRSV